MAFSRVSMRKIREILRLHLQAGLKYRQIARSCSTTHATVGKYVEAAKQAGLDWPLPEELADDETLIARLFPDSVSATEPSRPDEASFGSGSNKHGAIQCCAMKAGMDYAESLRLADKLCESQVVLRLVGG